MTFASTASRIMIIRVLMELSGRLGMTQRRYGSRYPALCAVSSLSSWRKSGLERGLSQITVDVGVCSRSSTTSRTCLSPVRGRGCQQQHDAGRDSIPDAGHSGVGLLPQQLRRAGALFQQNFKAFKGSIAAIGMGARSLTQYGEFYAPVHRKFEAKNRTQGTPAWMRWSIFF